MADLLIGFSKFPISFNGYLIFIQRLEFSFSTSETGLEPVATMNPLNARTGECYTLSDTLSDTLHWQAPALQRLTHNSCIVADT